MNQEELLLTDQQIGEAAYKHNPKYAGGVLEWTRKPDADLQIAKDQLAKVLNHLPELAKEAGYVKLAQSQSLDVTAIMNSASTIPLHLRIIEAVFEQGWRKVEGDNTPKR